MSTNIDPNLPPAPEPEEQQPPTADPWQAYQQAGFTPEANPYELRQHLDWVEAVTDPARREAVLEQSHRQWGDLPEEVSYREWVELGRQLAAQRQDPFAQPQPAPQPQFAAPEPTYGYEQPMAPAQPAIDPNQMRQVWQQDMRQVLAEERQALEQQFAAQRFQDDLERQLDAVASKNQLDAIERQWVWDRAIQRLGAQQVPPHEVAQIMESSWREVDQFTQARMARAVQAQGQAPRTMTPTGAVPGSLPPPTGLAGASARMRARVGLGPED